MLVHLKNKEEFNKIISENKKVLVDFFATWCGPCKMLSPIIEELANEVSDVTFVKVDVDEFQDLAAMFKVVSIPTIVVFENGKVVKQNVGYLPKAGIKNLL